MSDRAPSTPICVRLPAELAARVDHAAGGNRSAWIKRAIEDRLGSGQVGVSTTAPEGASVSGQPPVSRSERFRRAEALRRAGKSPGV